MMKNWSSLILGCILALLTVTNTLFALPARILVIRHAEEPSEGNSLSQKGRERAGALPYYFLETLALIKYGTPVAIFAMNPSAADPSQRSVQTITPLAQMLKLPIQTQYTLKQERELAEHILTNLQYDGKTVVVCWEHVLLPDLVYHLGIQPRPNPYPDSRNDLTWIVTYGDAKTPTLKVKPQKLMYGDSSMSFNPFNQPDL
jgi:hypothetical protein